MKGSSNRKNDLVIAILTNNIEVVRSIISEGMVINAEIQDGTTPLHLAAMSDLHYDISRFLIAEAGVDVNSCDRDGATPLITASRNNAINTVRLLIENGADVNARENNGGTALSHAENHSLAGVIKILEENGATEE